MTIFVIRLCDKHSSLSMLRVVYFAGDVKNLKELSCQQIELVHLFPQNFLANVWKALLIIGEDILQGLCFKICSFIASVAERSLLYSTISSSTQGLLRFRIEFNRLDQESWRRKKVKLHDFLTTFPASLPQQIPTLAVQICVAIHVKEFQEFLESSGMLLGSSPTQRLLKPDLQPTLTFVVVSYNNLFPKPP